jgi:hypothetical protein
MRTTLALAFTSLLALSAPAFAQSAGAPNPSGTGVTGSGSNTPGSGGVHAGDPAYRNGQDSGMSEGRAAAPDDGMNNGAPRNNGN